MSKYEYDPKDPFQLDRIGQQLGGPGKIFDLRCFWGTLRGIAFGCFGIYAGWHFDEFFVWAYAIFDRPLEIDPVRQSWTRLWAVIFGGGIILTSIACMIMIPINRRRAARSAVGQWYDDPALTREALHGTPDEPDGCEAGAPGGSDHARREEKSS